MNATIIDFNGVKYDTGIALNNINEIDVSIISGDEQLIIMLKDGKIRKLDASDFSGLERFVSYHDGSYIVNELQLEEWNNREDSYIWKEHEPFSIWDVG